MQLSLEHSFDRNQTLAAIARGKYSNIRTMQVQSRPLADAFLAMPNEIHE
jgi:hypothetical protein